MKYFRRVIAICGVCICILACNSKKKDFLEDYNSFVTNVEMLAANKDVSTITEIETSKQEFDKMYALISEDNKFSYEEQKEYVQITQRYEIAKKTLDKALIKSEVKETVNAIGGFLKEKVKEITK